MEYKEELVHNMLTAAHNTVVSVAKKVQDNVLRVMTAPVAMLPFIVPKTPEAEDPRTRSAGRPAEGAQCPRHKIGTYAFGQAQGSQATA